jgi:D-alanine-D-alanine ligase
LALIRGGKSAEREVSLASGREVLLHLDPKRYDVRVYDPLTDLAKLVSDAPGIDVAFPVLHGLYGEDGSLQGFLTLLGIPFVGSGILASARAMDKNVAKRIFRAADLPVAKDVVFRRGDDEDCVERSLSVLDLPVVVKPSNQGSSFGLSVAKTRGELESALAKARAYSGDLMVEEYLKGREFTVAVIGNNDPEALPPIEIIPGEGHGFFDYGAKYEPGECRELCPADLPPEETELVKDLALKAHEAMGCRGLSRTDFILSDGVFRLLELNTLPGMTSGSLIPKAAKARGLSFPALLDRLIELALEKDWKLPNNPGNF